MLTIDASVWVNADSPAEPQFTYRAGYADAEATSVVSTSILLPLTSINP
jgi:hypothetical protein